MKKRFTGRAERIKAYLIKHGSATMAELHQECGDGELRNTSSTVYQLVATGKARRTGGGRAAVFHRTDLTGHDGRGKGKRGGTSPKVKATPLRKVRQAAPAKPPAPSPWAFGGKTRGPGGAPERETVEEFLARGGRIERLPQGASATPMTGGHAALNEATWRDRQERLTAIG